MTEGMKSERIEPRTLEQATRKKRVVVLLPGLMYLAKGGLVFPLTISQTQRPEDSVVGRTGGASSRMRAVQSEYQRSSRKDDLFILATGGPEKGGIGSRAEGHANALVERYSLPPESVVSIEGRPNTLGDATAAIEYVLSHKDKLGDVDTIEIVTNDYHMLRTWIMFSSKALEAAGKKLEVSEQDKENIKNILDASFLGQWDARRMKDTRDVVMQILTPYFAESKIKIKPIVAEEVLEFEGQEGNTAKGKYAELLRNNSVMPEVLRAEYKGVIDFLEGRYKSVTA
jgi:hypothetical protein